MLSLLIPESVQKETVKRLSKLAKKAGVEVKALTGITTIILPRIYRYTESGKPYVARTERAIQCSRVLVGDMPRSNGWAFVARLEHTEAGNMVVCAPGEEIEPTWRTVEAVCEHCATSRRRRDTFVLRGPNGERKQIGRNCLADFLMCSATELVAQADLLKTVSTESDPDYEGGWGGSSCSMPTTDEFLACAVSAIERDGFRKTNVDNSTRMTAEFFAGRCPPLTSYPGSAEHVQAWKDGQPTEAYIERAKKIRVWGAELTAAETAGSDYLWNLHLACKLIACDVGRYGGILASVPAAYDRAMGIEHEKKAQKPVSKHVGTLGKRETFQVTFKFRGSYDNEFGGGVICNFEDSEGNEIVWFTSGDCPGSEELNTKMTITGKVKKHGDRKGRAQTVLSRCKWAVAK